MHIKKITGSIKGGVDADLTEKTLIVGNNGAGKSAIVNAVELALVGGASDIEGRAWVTAVNRLKRLGEFVNVQATLNDETACTFKIKKNKAEHQNGVNGSLPYREVREALTGSASKAYKYLLNQCAQDLTVDEVKARIPSDLHGLYMSVAGYGNSAVEGLLEAQEVAAKNARDTAKEVKGAKEAANLAGQGLGPLVLSSQIAEVYETMRAARQYAENKETRQKIEQYTQEIEALKEQRAQCEKWVEQFRAQGDCYAIETCKTLDAALSLHIKKQASQCGVCGSPFNMQFAQDSLNIVRKQIADREHAFDRMIRHENNKGHYTREIEKREYFLQQQETYDAQKALTVGDPGITFEAAEKHHRELTERLGAHAQHQKLQGHVNTLQQRATSWKSLADLLNTLVADFVDAGMARFMARVQGFLCESDVFGIKLTKSDCQVGFIRDGVLTSALSGVEWARLLTAIACACSDDGVPVVIPEDRMWDRETLATTMRALTSAPCQIILTSTEKPKGKLPAGWSLVEVT